MGNGTPTTGCFSDNPWANGVAPDYYWTSTTFASNASSAWQVLLHVAVVTDGPKDTAVWGWPVRGGQ